MPLVNVKKKIEKASSDKTGIRPDESVLKPVLQIHPAR